MEGKQERVSVVLASFNGEKYIEEQLTTIVNQTVVPHEVIVSDDGSTDQTKNILANFVSRYPFINCVENEGPRGISANFNNALFRASGDVIFLSDQDDLWYPDKIELMLAELNKKPSTMLLLSDAHIFRKEVDKNFQTKLQYFEKRGTRYFCTGCCMAIRREFLDIAIPIPTTVPMHDVWLNELGERLGLKSVMPVPLMKYRRHGDNYSDHASSKPRSSISFVKSTLLRLQDRRSKILTEFALLNVAIERLEKKSGKQVVLSEHEWNRRLQLVDEQLLFERRRLLAFEVRIVRRLVLLVRLFASGGYFRHKGGFKSLLADLIT